MIVSNVFNGSRCQFPKYLTSSRRRRGEAAALLSSRKEVFEKAKEVWLNPEKEEPGRL